MRFILKLLIFFGILFIGIATLATYWTFYSPLPEYNSNLQLTGLQEQVDVHWDPYAVPYIYAENEEDLYYTIGYIHAQERLWQMTLSQIAAEGRFAEFLGKDLIEYDIHQRTIGFWETAQQIKADASLGDVLEEPVESVEFGRIAAQAAKQVIVQKVREAERSQIVEAYLPKINELVSGTVKKIKKGASVKTKLSDGFFISKVEKIDSD